MVDLELVGTSRRSQGSRPRTFEHRQLLRLDNSQSYLPECVTFKRDCIVCSNVLEIFFLRDRNTDMRTASNVVHVTCICALVKVETASKVSCRSRILLISYLWEHFFFCHLVTVFFQYYNLIFGSTLQFSFIEM